MCVFQVIEDDKQWWKLRNRSGQAGYVPYNLLDVVKLNDPDAFYSQVSCSTPFTYAGSSICIQVFHLLNFGPKN